MVQELANQFLDQAKKLEYRGSSSAVHAGRVLHMTISPDGIGQS